MPTTIGVTLVLSSGKTNLSLQLFASGVLLNTGGDALTEVGTSGFFQASVDEAIVATLDAIVLEGAVAVYGGTLYLGQSQVDRVAPAPSANENATAIWSFDINAMSASSLLGQASEFAEDASIAAGQTLVIAELIAGTGFDTATDSLVEIRAAVSQGVDTDEFATAISARLAVIAMRRLGDASRFVSDVTVTRGTTWRIPISVDDLPDNWTRIEFTARAKHSDSQGESLAHVVRNNPLVIGQEGLIILRSQPASNASLGTITIVDDRPIAIINHAAVADVAIGEYCWDAKVTTAGGIEQISRGMLFVEPDVTRV